MATQPLQISGGVQSQGFIKDGKKLLTLSYGLTALNTMTAPIAQRVYDTGLGAYVYYVKTFVDPSPAPGETSPNHTGSLDPATHEML